MVVGRAAARNEPAIGGFASIGGSHGVLAAITVTISMASTLASFVKRPNQSQRHVDQVNILDNMN